MSFESHQIQKEMENRFGKAKQRLFQKEEAIKENRDLAHRLGQVLPDETIPIPRIGEWSLNQHLVKTPLTDKINEEKPRRDVKPFPRGIPLNTSQRQRIEINQDSINSLKARPKNAAAPYKIKAPKTLSALKEEKIQYPSGTMTTDISDILKSKYRKPLPPLVNSLSPNDPKFLPLETFDDLKYAEYPIDILMKDPKGHSKQFDLDGNAQ